MLSTLLTLHACLALGDPGEALHRVNCGGKLYVDQSGKTWDADRSFSGGSKGSTSQPIAGTDDDVLYQTERWGSSFQYGLAVPPGGYAVVLHFAEIFFNDPGKRIFDVDIEGATLVDDLDVVAATGSFEALTRTVLVDVTDGTLDLAFTPSKNNAKVAAIEVFAREVDHPFLEAVVDGPSWDVDDDEDGQVAITLDGSASTTYEPGFQIVTWTWTSQGQTLGTQPILETSLPLGTHVLTLTIEDDHVPPEQVSRDHVIRLDPLDAVGGALVSYHALEPGGSRSGTPDHLAVSPTLTLEPNGSCLGVSRLTGPARIVSRTRLDVAQTATYRFRRVGGAGGAVRVDGTLTQGPRVLTAGRHDLEWIVRATTSSDLPASLLASVDGGPFGPLPAADLTHDQSRLAPHINHLPAVGSALGGERVTLEGVGFFPTRMVQLAWGPDRFMPPTLEVTSQRIAFVTPPGEGTIDVQLFARNGPSPRRAFTYDEVAPVRFTSSTLLAVDDPTCGAWGPDERLYIGTLSGAIHAVSFDDDHQVTSVEVLTALVGLINPQVMAIAFDPFDAAGPPRPYVAHTLLAQDPGGCSDSFSTYHGQVTRLDGPTFAASPIITGLPTSNFVHGLPAMAFDDHGELLIASAANTNAGVPDCAMGGLPASPLSAAILRAPLSSPTFDGHVQYIETLSGSPNDDQRFGDLVDVGSGFDVTAWATGVRNPVGFARTRKGRLFVADHGAVNGLGARSKGQGNEGSDPTSGDELLRIAQGSYYGHANRNRGRTDPRESWYRAPRNPSRLGRWVAAQRVLPNDTANLLEYRASTFGGRLSGHLVLATRYGDVRTLLLDDAGLEFDAALPMEGMPTGSAVVEGLGGSLLVLDIVRDQVTLARPDDLAADGLTADDIHPWRAPSTAATPFVVSGSGFGPLASMRVTFGGDVATLTSVSPTRIRGVVPTASAPSAALVDVVVEDLSTGEVERLTQAFRRVLAPGEGVGAWEGFEEMPRALGEVACAAIDGVLYVVGETSNRTLAMDLATGVWRDDLAERPFPGNHHAAEVLDGRWYLFGGLAGGSYGRVQIYDPAADAWTLGTRMPFHVGSASSACIDGKVYVVGGILTSNTTTDEAAVYDPQLDTWTSVAPMPAGRNHAAAGTDGDRLFLFGGRGPGSGDGNFVAEGFDDVQIYDPVTDQWETSFDSGSTIPPLPQRRGGMGRAAWFRGEFWIFGGETDQSGVPKGVYDRVDVYNPTTKTWRLDAPMPTARHGIYPVDVDGRLWVVAGGTKSGFSSSGVVEVLGR